MIIYVGNDDDAVVTDEQDFQFGTLFGAKENCQHYTLQGSFKAASTALKSDWRALV